MLLLGPWWAGRWKAEEGMGAELKSSRPGLEEAASLKEFLMLVLDRALEFTFSFDAFRSSHDS